MKISLLRSIGQMIEPHDIPAIPEFRESVVDHHLPRGASRVDASSSFYLQVGTVQCMLAARIVRDSDRLLA